MSEMQKKRENKKNDEKRSSQKQPEVEKGETVKKKEDQQMRRTVAQIITEPKELTETYEELYQKFISSLPAWVRAPWAYITPKVPNQIETWTENWSGLVIEYCRTTKTHIVNIENLRTLHPFKNKTNNRGLTSQQMIFLAEHLVNRELARWIEPKLRLRVLWLTEEELAMDLYNYMINTGKAIEYWTLLDLRKEGQVWSTLPIDELRKTCEILEQKNLLHWLDKEKTTIEFIIT